MQALREVAQRLSAMTVSPAWIHWGGPFVDVATKHWGDGR